MRNTSRELKGKSTAYLTLLKQLEGFIWNYYLEAIEYYEDPYTDLPDLSKYGIDVERLGEEEIKEIVKAVAWAEAVGVAEGLRKTYLDDLFKYAEFCKYLDDDTSEAWDKGIIGVNYALKDDLETVEVEVWIRDKNKFDEYIREYWTDEEIDNEWRQYVLNRLAEDVAESIEAWEKEFYKWYEGQRTLSWLIDEKAFEEELKYRLKEGI